MIVEEFRRRSEGGEELLEIFIKTLEERFSKT